MKKFISLLVAIAVCIGLCPRDIVASKKRLHRAEKKTLTDFFAEDPDTNIDAGAKTVEVTDSAAAKSAPVKFEPTVPVIETGGSAQPVVVTPTTPQSQMAAKSPTPEQPAPTREAPQVIKDEDLEEGPQQEEIIDRGTPEQRADVAVHGADTGEDVDSGSKIIEFDSEKKRKTIIKLVDDGIAYLSKNKIDQAFSAFSHDKKFLKGDAYLFVFDAQGVCLSSGQEGDLIWQDLHDLRDTYGIAIVQEMIKKAHEGGGWITYQWRNATKVSYVKEVQKDGATYIIGSGYYPHSKIDAVVSLVKGAVALFNETVAQGRSTEEALSSYSYPLGRFVLGDLYLYAVDFNGLQLAHGNMPGLIGSNEWNYKDANGKLVNQEIIKRLKDKEVGSGIWIDYVSKNAPKMAYAEKVKDKAGNYYFIACGYYPDADRKQVVNLVRRGYTFMKSSGKTVAVEEFDKKKNSEFQYGDLYLFVYTLKGVCIADGGNSENVGQNMYDAQDQDGVYYVRDLIKKAQDGGGWVDCKLKNSFQSIYVEKVDLSIDQYVIGSGIYPISKRETMMLVTKSGADYLKSNEPKKAFGEFVKKDGRFIRGDLGLFAFDSSGICLAYADEYDRIWRNLLAAKDDAGIEYVKAAIDTAKRGPGTVTYKINGQTKVIYVEPVQKDGKLFVVGTGFYL